LGLFSNFIDFSGLNKPLNDCSFKY